MSFVFLNRFIKQFKSGQKIILQQSKLFKKNIPASNQTLKYKQYLKILPQQNKITQYNKKIHQKTIKPHHFNEIIQEIYYHDVKFVAESKIKKEVNQTIKNNLLSEKQQPSYAIKDKIAYQIRDNILPLELLQIHEQNKSQFNHQHYQMLLNRLFHYLQYFQTIKSQKIKAWEISRLQQRDSASKDSKCPYLFLTKEEIVRHKYWLSFVQNVNQKVEKQQKITEVNKYLKVALQIAKIFKQLPSQLYESLLYKNVNSNFQLLSKSDISEILRLLKQQKKLKYYKNIVVSQVKKEIQICHLFRFMTESVLNNFQDYTIYQLMNIFKLINLQKSRINVLNQQNIEKSNEIISKFIHQLLFEDIYVYFAVYSSKSMYLDLSFLQTLKFNLYRKAQNCINVYYIVILLGKIKEKKLIIKNYYNPDWTTPIELDAGDLAQKLGQSVTKFISKSILNLRQILTIIDFCYSNDTNDMFLVQQISSELIKKANQLSLELLTKNCFKITLLGHRSKILVKFVFQKFIQNYQSMQKKYEQEEKQILSNRHRGLESQQSSLNFKMMYLQECLIMSIWSLIQVFDEKQYRLENEINLKQLLGILPLKIQSMDPLIYQLVLYINHTLQKYCIFPKMQCSKYDPLKYPLGRFNQFYKPNSFKSYIQKEMDYEVSLLGNFIITYNQKENKFMRQKWSKLNYYSKEEYVQWILANPETKASFFDKDKLLINEQLFIRRSRTAKLAAQNKLEDQL